MIFSTTRVSSIFSSYLFIWLYIANTLAKYFEILSDLSICNFSKSPHSFYRCTFLTLSTSWFDFCKTSHIYLAVVALSTILKVVSSRHWWMIVNANWSFFHTFCTTFLQTEVNVALFIGSSKPFFTVSHTSWEPNQDFTRIHQVW